MRGYPWRWVARSIPCMKLWFAFCTALLLCILVVASDPEPAPGPALMSVAHAETAR